MKPKRADDVTKLASDASRELYFWRIGRIQCGSHVTRFTPQWCELHMLAFDTVCPSCRIASIPHGRKGPTSMALETQTTEREIEFELTDDEKEQRRASFESAWEKEQVVKAEKLIANQGFNADLKELRALQKAAHDAFTIGKEKRLVQVYERAVERLGNVEIVEKETGKVVDSRPMTPEERQVKMFPGADGEATTVKAKSNGNGKAARKPELTKEPLTASVGEHAKRARKGKRKREARP